MRVVLHWDTDQHGTARGRKRWMSLSNKGQKNLSHGTDKATLSHPACPIPSLENDMYNLWVDL